MATRLSAEDVRAQRARLRIPLYQLAARVNVNPARLSTILNEHLPLTSDLAARLERALDAMAGERRSTRP